MQKQYANKIITPLLFNTLAILCFLMSLSLWEIYELRLLNPIEYDYIHLHYEPLC